MITTVEEVVDTTLSDLTENAATAREYEKEFYLFRNALRERQWQLVDANRSKRFKRIVDKVSDLCWGISNIKTDAEESLLRHIMADDQAVGST